VRSGAFTASHANLDLLEIQAQSNRSLLPLAYRDRASVVIKTGEVRDLGRDAQFTLMYDMLDGRL
jgi:hypothetical protein